MTLIANEMERLQHRPGICPRPDGPVEEARDGETVPVWAFVSAWCVGG